MRFKGKKPIFGYKDTFSLDCVLSSIILAGLKKFKETIQNSDIAGCPVDFTEKYERVDGKISEEDHLKATEEWHSVLDKMIYAFDDKQEDNIDIPEIDLIKVEDDGEKFPPGFSEYKTVAKKQEVYKKYKEDMIEHIKKKQEGLDLFAKYYNCLWW